MIDYTTGTDTAEVNSLQSQELSYHRYGMSIQSTRPCRRPHSFRLPVSKMEPALFEILKKDEIEEEMRN